MLGAEVAVRSLIGRTSGWGALAIASIDARTVQEACIPGTLSPSIRTGSAHRGPGQLAGDRGELRGPGNGELAGCVRSVVVVRTPAIVGAA